MAKVFTKQFFAQFISIREISVVAKREAVRRIDIERLGFRGGIASGSRITHVADTHIALESDHVSGVEYVPHEAVVLAQINPFAVAGNDSSCVLAPVLQYRQPVVNGLVNRPLGQNTDDSAHGEFSVLKTRV